jgi:hypothetical protein
VVVFSDADHKSSVALGSPRKASNLNVADFFNQSLGATENLHFGISVHHHNKQISDISQVLKPFKSSNQYVLQKKPTNLSPNTEHIQEASIGRISNISGKNSNKRIILLD